MEKRRGDKKCSNKGRCESEKEEVETKLGGKTKVETKIIFEKQKEGKKI